MAPSSFKKIGVAVAYASAVKAATQSYQISEEYTTDNFFDKFDFFTSTYTDGDSWDPTHGYVQYRSQADAESLGLISTSNGQIYIGPDHSSTYDPEGKGRDSVRITSKATYNGGLMVAKFAHLPVQACGAWPAFWSYASPWLTTGEIDFYEGWNLMGYNRIAMHVNETLAGECTLSSTNVAGTVMTDDCNNDIDGSGCGVHDASDIWGSTSGGTFAWEWTDSAIKVWSWTPGNVPSDVAAGTPNPSSDSWGEPQLLVEQSNCDLTKSFGDLQLTFNIDFCGDTAGSPSIWNQTCSAQGSSCASYVASNPSAFANTYFSVDSIKFYELKDVVATSSAAIIASTSAAATIPTASSTGTQDGLLAGTASILESTLDISSSVATASATHATAAAAAAAQTTPYSHTTSYVYGTSTSTDETGSETTVVVVVDTTICPVTASETSVSSDLASESSVAAATETTGTPATSETAAVASSSTPAAAAATSTSTLTSSSTQFTTSTIFSTSSSTITSCASTASACTTGDVTTVVVAVSTTICPVTATEGSASTKASTAVVSGSAGFSGTATSENSAAQATGPGSPAGTTAATSLASKTTLSSTLKSTLTRSSAITLVTSSTSAGTTGTEVETATDTAGALVTASGTPTGNAAAHNYGNNGTVTGATTLAGASASSTSSCSGLDCVVVSSSGHQMSTTLGASGFALAVFAGAAFLL